MTLYRYRNGTKFVERISTLTLLGTMYVLRLIAIFGCSLLFRAASARALFWKATSSVMERVLALRASVPNLRSYRIAFVSNCRADSSYLGATTSEPMYKNRKAAAMTSSVFLNR